MQFFKFCCRIIVLQYSSCLLWHDFSTHMHDVTINQLFIQNYTDHYDDLLVCAWEDQRENQYYICHKISSILYGKYSTVVSKYSTVILIYHVVNNPP